MREGSTFVVLLFLSVSELVFADCPGGDAELHEEARLYNDLSSCPSRYRPVLDYKSTVDVHLRLALKYITFDNTEEKITLNSWVAVKWKDEFLYWTPNDYSNIKEIQMQSTEIWSPPIMLINADATTYQSDSFYTTCLLSYDGTITCVPQMSHTAICRTSLRLWPYDEKTCTLYFGTTMHTTEQVNLTFYKTRPILMDDFQNAPGWKLINVFFQRLKLKLNTSANNTFPRLKYVFKLRREAAGVAVIIIIPSVVIVLLTLSSLLLPVKDNTRLGMLCFSLLGHFVYITDLDYFMPKLSADTPIILLFIRDSMIVTLVGIMETLLLMYLRRRRVPAPTWVVSVNRLVTSGPGKYVVFTEFDPCDGEAGKVITEDSGNTNEDRTQIHTDWIQFSNLINSFIFIVSLIVYLILICMKIPTANSV